MSEINRALGSAGAPVRLCCGDKTYLLSSLTKGIQGELEEWLYGRAVAGIPSHLDAEGYATAAAVLAERRAGGAYDFTGKLMGKALRTVDGMVELLRLMLRKHWPEVAEDDVLGLMADHGRECVAAINAMAAGLKKKAEAQTTGAGAAAS